MWMYVIFSNLRMKRKINLWSSEPDAIRQPAEKETLSEHCHSFAVMNWLKYKRYKSKHKKKLDFKNNRCLKETHAS